MKNLEFIQMDLEFVNHRVIFYEKIKEINTENIINEIKKIQELKKSDIPVYYKWSKSGKSVSLFNEAGQKIKIVDNLIGYEKLNVIHSDTQVSRKINLLLEKMKIEVAVRLGLPIFKNGNLYSETKKQLLKLGIN